ncbi:amino acid adenylation domain-containing protein [Melittangium boletus]
MSVELYVSELESRGIELWVEAERLRYRAAKEQVTPAFLAELKARKDELLPFLRVRAELPRSHPVSHGQQSLWMLYQLAPRSAAYNIVYAARLFPSLDVEALRRAAALLVERHAILRTTYSFSEGKLAQQVHPRGELRLEVVDTSGQDARAVQALIDQESDRPFDLREGPVLRLTLLTRQDAGATGPTLLLTVHHIAADFWSLELLVKDLSALYESARAGTAPTLAPVRVRFPDYVRWESERLSGARGEALRTYWTQQLRGATTVLELPTDRPRPPLQRFDGARYSLTLDASLTQRLREQAKALAATPYVLLLSAFQVLLSRYSGQDEVIIGTPTAGRDMADSEGVVGNFINPVAIRGDVSGDPSFRQLVGRTRGTFLRALEHADYPLSLLVKELALPRDASRSALYQVMYTWHQQHQRDGQGALSGQGLVAEVLDGTMQRGASQELLLAVHDAPERLVCNWTYSVDLFERETVERMGAHLQGLLERIVSDVDVPLSRLEFLPEAERARLVRGWNETEVGYEGPETIHAWIERQVERTPGAMAVEFEGERLTYAELNTRANQLAHHLKRLGVGRGQRVGLCLERSVEMVVGLVGVLKAGAAYVPMDPGYPSERLAYMVGDARVPVLLTQQRCLSLLPAHEARTVVLDSGWAEVAREPEHNPASEVGGADLAYVIYTSGSTGKPKGAMNTHEAIRNRLLWMQAEYGLSGADRVLQKTPFSFDVSVWEFFWPLMMGAGLVVARPEGHRDARYLAELIDASGVSTLHFVPSMLQVFLDEPKGTGLASLRQVFCSGEALPKALRDRFLERYPGKALHNLYGPTEAAVDVSYWDCRQESGYEGVPIGKPVANTQLYVLDKHLRPVPVGVAGELFIGGVQLARGYLERPELTAERFIPDPHSPVPGARLYRTGDLTRRLPDGNIDYLGRIDHQVKIRGLRIELGEVEATLASHPAVRETVVVAQKQGSGSTQLVGYYVVKSGAQVSDAELRAYLGSRLPDYMVPPHLVVMDAFPLSPNGKVERKLLPAVGAHLESSYTPPTTELEQLLVSVWRDVLKREQVGIHDNFFQLGGDSILSIRIVAQAASHGLSFSIQELFQYQTVSQLAAFVSGGRANTEARASAVRFGLLSAEERGALPADVTDAYPLTALQAGMLFHSQLDAGSSVYHDVFSFHLRARLDVALMERALVSLMASHEVLRTSFLLRDEARPLQLVHREAPTPLAVEDVSGLSTEVQETRIKQWCAEERHRPFAWARAPLFRVQLHLRDAEHFQLTLSFHHSILDGWSVAVLLSSLLTGYHRLLAGQSEGLGAPVSRFHDFVALEEQEIASEANPRFWREELKGAVATQLPRLPFASTRAKGQELGFHEVPLPARLSARLTELARETRVSVKSVLLAAHLNVLGVVTGQDDLVTGVISSGRLEEGDGERALGLFLNTLPFRLRRGEGTWSQLIQRTSQKEHALVPHRRFPLFEIQRLHDRQLFFETAFNFTNFHVFQDMLTLEGLKVVAADIFEQTNLSFVASFSQDVRTSTLRLQLNFDKALYPEAQVAQLATCYARVLEAMASEPQRRYDTFTLLPADEQSRILRGWNETEVGYEGPETIHAWIERQVERTPGAMAVEFEGERLTYAELNARANQMAHHLKRLGVGRGQRVGLCLERSVEMVVGLVGVLKAGAAYVPMDPGYPSERLAYMVGDARVPVLLTQQRCLSLLPAHEARTVVLDSGWAEVAREPEHNPASEVGGADLAYVIYTSGSTGKPKGAMNTHEAIRNRLLWMQAEYGLSGADRVLQKTPFSFDVSVWEFFWPLMMGAGLVVARPEGHRDARYLAELIDASGVSTLHFVPSMLQVFLDEPKGTGLASLRQVFCSGEALPKALRDRFLERYPGKALHNLYGPTEAAVDVSYWDCRQESGYEGVPIGKPVANTQLYVLDKHLRPVPVGVAGELFIGGVQLARGYLERPELDGRALHPGPAQPRSRRAPVPHG